MQRNDLQPYERIPLLHDLDDAERGMIITDNNKSLIKRLEECIYALSMQDELHKYHNTALTFHCAASILILMTPAIIEAIIVLTTLNIPNTAFLSRDDYNRYNSDSVYCPDNIYQSCVYAHCGENYPIDNFNHPWPYAYPSWLDHYSILYACYSMYEETTDNAFFDRTIIIAVASFANLIISCALLLVTIGTAPQRQPLFSDRTTLAMLPKKIQDEINDLATKTSTIITDSHNINEIIQALRPALEERQRARQRRAFLSGSLAQNENSPLYRFFNGQTVNDKYVRGDGDMATTERIFKYAGLLKTVKHP